MSRKVSIENVHIVAWTQYGITESDMDTDIKTALKILEELDREYEDITEFLEILREGE